jgi:DNA-binding transcriptional ArsR family regulator
MIESLVSRERAFRLQLHKRRIGNRTISAAMQKSVLISLAGLPRSVNELAAIVPTTLRTVRYTLRALEDQNLVVWRRRR